MRILDITPHPRVGPALFVLLGCLTAYLAFWLPVWIDHRFPPETDTRISFIYNGFAPMTTGTAILAIYGYGKLCLLQKREKNTFGRVMLAVMAPLLYFFMCTG